jgi:hypothetical protein
MSVDQQKFKMELEIKVLRPISLMNTAGPGLEPLSLETEVNCSTNRATAACQGLISPTLLAPKQSSYCAALFQQFLWQQRLAKLRQNRALGANAVT